MRSIAALLSATLLVLCSASCGADAPATPAETHALVVDDLNANSMIADTLGHLSDVYGPRLSGTPRYLKMAEWTAQRVAQWGIDNVRIESFGDDDRGWEALSFSAELIEPAYAPLGAQLLCCSRSTDGVVEDEPLLLDFQDFAALEAHRGKLRGRILLHPELPPPSEPETGRWSDERLRAAAERGNPVTPDGLDGPGSEFTYLDRLREQAASANAESEDTQIARFLIDEGVAAVLMPSGAPAGVVSNRVNAGAVEFHGTDDPEPVPFFVVPREQYARLLNLYRLGNPPRVAVSAETRYYDDPAYHVNVIAEVPGSDPELADEIVLLGAHLDSVEMAPGAADNAIGSAASMEVLRIIKSLNLKPRRTVRVAFWGGEEQGLKGSSAYVEKYIGDLLSQSFFGEHEKISAYFNHDNNGHDIRGMFLVGHHQLKSIFKPIFSAFSDVGGDTVTIELACCTDIVVFDATGIPSFEWIHDPGPYFTHQLHTDLDTTDLVSIDSANRNTAIIATVVYETAMLDEILPRKAAQQDDR